MNQFSSAKILKHLDRIVEWQKTGISRPITYELDMTNACNSKCHFCFGFSGRESDHSSIDLQDVKDLLRQIKDFGGKGLTFTGGGEPLCNAGTIEAVRYARELGLDIGFITNGVLLDEKKTDVLVDCCTWIRVSLDAGTKEVYERTHGLNGDAFDTVVRNTKMLVRKKKKKQSRVTIGTGFITYPEVTANMLAYVKVSRDAGVDYAQFRPLLKKFDQREINMSMDDSLLEEIEKCRQLGTDTFHVLCSLHKYDSVRKSEAKRNYRRCYGHNFAAVISANMKMYLCCHVRGMEKYCLGDLKKNSLEEIWKSSGRKNVYEHIDFSDCPLLCRCDGFNRILWSITQRNEHENFL